MHRVRMNPQLRQSHSLGIRAYHESSASSGVLARCMQGDPLYPKKSINKRQMTRMLRQTNAWAKSGKIDATANLASQRIWLFHGYNDGVVKAAVTDALYAFYAHYVNSGQI